MLGGKTMSEDTVVLPECSVKLLGHNVYLRQCKKPDTYAGTGLFRPDKDVERSHVCEVLAVGPEVGKPRRETKKWCATRKIARHMEAPLKVGDFVMCQENSAHKLLFDTPFDKHEYIADEGVLMLLIPSP